MSEAGANDITLLVKDDRSTPEGAREAARRRRIGQGAELILGPLFAGDVRAAAEVAKRAPASRSSPIRPICPRRRAASTCCPSWSRIMSTAIVEFAASQGKKSIAVLAPENDYANVATGALQQAAAKRDIRVALIERYKAGARCGLGRQYRRARRPDRLPFHSRTGGAPCPKSRGR